MIKVKDAYLGTVVAYGHSALPLKERDDLIDLAILAIKSNDPTLLKLFDDLPPLSELLQAKTEQQLFSIRTQLLANEEIPSGTEAQQNSIEEYFREETKGEQRGEDRCEESDTTGLQWSSL
ncbi:hypothetical protein [Chitinophaga jiangningensis]|uniref:hypothetical protein n=1 Tax=Chitinophaga jiangningensis TaxID=1419482 RepID=UPI000933A29D|nr:hypothetical protein [Chitinophaga jiangningensis]